MNKKLIDVNELSEILRVPKSWIYDKTRQGQNAIPHTKLGKYVRFEVEEVINFFKNKTTENK